MASPVGHGLMGVAVYAATVPRRRLLAAWGWLALCVGASVLPDLDWVVPAAVGRIDVALWAHRSFTHTVFFAAAAALAAYGIARLAKARSRLAWQVAAVVLVCLLAHLALDVMNEDTRAPYGIAVFWPAWGKTFYAPIGLLPRVEKLTYADVVSWHNVKVAFTEIGLFGALILVVLGVRLGLAWLTGSTRATGRTRDPVQGAEETPLA
jgi:inner membrane protein